MTPAPRSVHVLRLLAAWAGLAVLSWGAVRHAGRLPAVVPPSALPQGFSAGRAIVHVQAIAARPHPVGSMAGMMVRAYIESELRSLAIEPQLQSTTAVGTRYAAAGEVTNVLARLPGAQPGGKAVLLMAHYDAVPAGPGAGDDASGAATLLETLRALRSGPPLAHDVVALFTDGEEAGLLGAAAFAREHPWAKDVGVVLNFEARGTTGPALMFETGPGNLDVARVLRRVRGARATSLSTAVYRRLPNDTDLSELATLGLPALNFAFIGGAERYHTAQDDAAHLDIRSLQHEGNQAVTLARTFGNGPLPRPHTGDAVFFDVPLLGLVVYPESLAIAFAVLGFLLAVAVLYRQRAGGWRAPVLGGAATLLGAIASSAAGYAVVRSLDALHESLHSGVPDTSGAYALALVFCTIAVTGALLALAARWSRGTGGRVATGALAAWAAVTVFVSIAAPGASFVFTWPLVAVAAASLLPEGSVVARVALWTAAAVAVFIVVPIVYMMACIALGVSQGGAVVIALFVSLLVALLNGLVSGDRELGWWTPLFAAAAAVACIAVGAATVRTNIDHPVGGALVYAMDDSGAWITGRTRGSAARAALHEVLGAVRAAVPDHGTSVAPPAWLRGSFPPSAIVAAPRVDAPLPTATILSDSTVGMERRLRIRVLAGGPALAIAMATRADVLRSTVGGKNIRRDMYRQRTRAWALTFAAPPDTGIVLGLTVPAAAAPTALSVSARRQGIPPLPGVALPRPPEGVIPSQSGSTTWAHRELHL